jgi:hypothetical protein
MFAERQLQWQLSVVSQLNVEITIVNMPWTLLTKTGYKRLRVCLCLQGMRKLKKVVGSGYVLLCAIVQ